MAHLPKRSACATRWRPLIHVHEEWDSAEALQRHFATPHMADFRRRLPDLVAAPPSIVRYDVAAATPML